MEKGKKKETTTNPKRFYSDYVEDKLFERYSVAKKYAEKDEEKVIRINWFCKNFDISLRTFKRVIDALCKAEILYKNCKLVFEI